MKYLKRLLVWWRARQERIRREDERFAYKDS